MSAAPGVSIVRTMKLKIVFALLAVSSLSHAEQVLPAEAAITFAGKSTLHDFTGQVTAAPFNIQISENPTNHLRECAATVAVTVTNMSTAKPARDRKMFAMFNAPTHPLIRAVVEHLPVPTGRLQRATVRLTIAGKEQTVAALVEDWQETNGQITFRLTCDVSLKEFGLEAPSVIGLIRVADKVHVDCAVKTRGGS
ncbi:MAG: hypothetical protein PCFJNLEI_01262 [Verrucomicrobiae bacterium]|nr:hypothetical protein [Verrucomicrobiae bacterium]